MLLTKPDDTCPNLTPDEPDLTAPAPKACEPPLDWEEKDEVDVRRITGRKPFSSATYSTVCVSPLGAVNLLEIRHCLDKTNETDAQLDRNRC